MSHSLDPKQLNLEALGTRPLRILVMRYRFIGDTVLLIPFLRACRAQYPDATIHVLVSPGSGEVLTYCPWIDQLIWMDTTRKHRYEGHNTKTATDSLWSMARRLKTEGYDMAFVLKRSFSSALIAFLARIPVRIGFDTEWRRPLLTQAVPYQTQRHEASCFLDVLTARYSAQLSSENLSNDLEPSLALDAWYTPEIIQRVKARLNQLLTPEQQTKPKILIHLTASNPEKCWPLVFWQALAPWLITTFSATLHCVGHGQDRSAYGSVLEAEPHLSSLFFNHCGETPLLESQALIQEMDLVVGVDSGVLHLAAAVNVPIVGFLLPKHWVKWSPLNLAPTVLLSDDDLSKAQTACLNLLASQIMPLPESLMITHQHP